MNIQKVIKRHGFTVSEVAKRMSNQRGGVGISQGALSTALNGNPTIDKLKEIAAIIGCSLSELVSDGTQLTALVKYGDEYYSADSTKKLREIADIIDYKTK